MIIIGSLLFFLACEFFSTPRLPLLSLSGSHRVKAGALPRTFLRPYLVKAGAGLGGGLLHGPLQLALRVGGVELAPADAPLERAAKHTRKT